jgi:hypothetical protein
MKTHISLFEIFRQRYPQISSHIFPKLEEVVIEAQKAKTVPFLQTSGSMPSTSLHQRGKTACVQNRQGIAGCLQD